MTHSSDRIAHTTALFTPVVEHWLEQEIAQWVHQSSDRIADATAFFYTSRGAVAETGNISVGLP